MDYRSSDNKMSQKGSRGFSLIEVLIGIAILSIGILAVATLEVTALQGNTTARMSTEAGKLAEAQAEILLGRPYTDPDLAAGSHDPVVVPGSRYTVRWQVTNSVIGGGGVSNFKTINITVSWSDRGIQKTAAIRLSRARGI